MTRESHSHSHESPSYKVHNSPYTSRYRYTYIMHNATTQSEKVKQTLPMFQGYGLVRYKKCKIDIAIPRECGPSKEQENKKGYMEGDPNTCSREETQRERDRENHSGRARPPNLLKIPLHGLASSCLHPCPFCLRLEGRTLTTSILAPYVYMQKTRKQTSMQAKEEIEGKHTKGQAG